MDWTHKLIGQFRLGLVCVHSAWKGCPRNDLYCVGWDVKPYSLTHWRLVCYHL